MLHLNCYFSLSQVVKAQAINILGSVDFLGNPMGLFSDVASGVSGMISVQPDVVGLVRDVAHGMSDTTSKVSFVARSLVNFTFRTQKTMSVTFIAKPTYLALAAE